MPLEVVERQRRGHFPVPYEMTGQTDYTNTRSTTFGSRSVTREETRAPSLDPPDLLTPRKDPGELKCKLL